MEHVFKKYDECLINCWKIAAEVSGGSNLCYVILYRKNGGSKKMLEL